MFMIDPMSRTPVYEQIVRQIEKMVLSGVLQQGDKLPSVRGLATELSINPNTIQKAYMEMDVRGLIASIPGKGIYVAEGARNAIAKGKKEQLLVALEKIISELTLCGMDADSIQKTIEEIVKGIQSKEEVKT